MYQLHNWIWHIFATTQPSIIWILFISIVFLYSFVQHKQRHIWLCTLIIMWCFCSTGWWGSIGYGNAYKWTMGRQNRGSRRTFSLYTCEIYRYRQSWWWPRLTLMSRDQMCIFRDIGATWETRKLKKMWKSTMICQRRAIVKEYKEAAGRISCAQPTFYRTQVVWNWKWI